MQNTDDDRPDLSLLPALDALLGTRNVTRAAQRMGLSQPAMSRIVAKLRVQFGDPLIVRSGGQSDLTPRAEALRLPLKAILEQAVQLAVAPRFDPLTTDRSFLLAVPDIVAAVLLPPLRDHLRLHAPGCRLVFAPWPGRGADLSSFDLAIATEPDIFPGFRIAPLYDDRDQLAFRAADGPPLADDALRRSHVAVVPVGFLRDLADDWLVAHDHQREIAVIVPHYLQALSLVAQSGLLAILPSRLVNTVGSALGVAGAELAIPQPPDRYWLLHPARLTDDPANQWIRKAVSEAMSPGATRKP